MTVCLNPARGQIAFTSADLPSRVGDYSRAYANASDSPVGTLIGKSGGPNRWDFSHGRAADEEIWRVDIVALSDGGHGSDFPAAAYAERTTRESSGKQSWSYYRIVPAQGRAYFGFYDPIGNATDPLTMFDAPTIDLPETIQYGQSWKRTVDWKDLLDLGFSQSQIAVHFTSEAKVDAYGTVVLPGIGEVPALRINEVNSYETLETTLGLPLGTQFFRNYYWLVKGLGKVVHIISKPESTAPSENFATAGTVLRVFESNTLQPPTALRCVTGLAISLKSSELFLNWQREAAATGYRVESVSGLVAEPWQKVQDTKDNFAFVPLSTRPHEFFRVCILP